MPRPKKYSSPEMSQLAHDYHVLRKQDECRSRIIAKLGGACSVCGSSDPNHLKVIGNSAHKSWSKRWEEVRNFSNLFSLQCANCNLEARNKETNQRLCQMAGTLFRDAMKNQTVKVDA